MYLDGECTAECRSTAILPPTRTDGILQSMKGWETLGVGWFIAAVSLTAGMGTAADLHLVRPDRTPVQWDEWLADRGSSAVLVWASWAPGASDCLLEIGELRRVAATRGLDLVVVAVQEEIEEAARGLAGSSAAWLHDRHGAILKQYRLIELPILIVVDESGAILVRLDATSAALSAWHGGE